jgi:hypothetical protein
MHSKAQGRFNTISHPPDATRKRMILPRRVELTVPFSQVSNHFEAVKEDNVVVSMYFMFPKK